MKHLARLACLLATCGLTPTVAQVQGPPSGWGLYDNIQSRLEEGEVRLVPISGGPTTLFATIQAAVDAAAEADTVLLSDGYFRGPGNREILVSGKNITIRGENGPENCIIDCESLGRGFSFEGPLVTPQTLLTGISIVHGDRAAPAQVGCGGAVLVSPTSRPTIENCIMAYCQASFGGAIEYEFNAGAEFGLIRDCLFVGNRSIGQGGAFSGAEVVIERCTFIGNRAEVNGGALDLAHGGGVVRDCLIRDNEARPDFGSNRLGGGIYQRAFGWTVENCTIVNNFAFGRGGGLAFGSDLIATVSNTILWGNTSTVAGQQVFAVGFFGGGQTTLLNCAIEGGAAGVDASFADVVPLLVSVVEEDPSFLDPQGNAFGLRFDSPCIDAGDPAFLVGPSVGDLDNQPRLNGIVDIGADEFWPSPALSLVSPGRVGEVNSMTAVGVTPGACVSFFFGTESRPFALRFPGCPSLSLDIGDAFLLRTMISGAKGRATYSQLVPSELSGETLLFQAVSFDPGRPQCVTSNLVTFTYP